MKLPTFNISALTKLVGTLAVAEFDICQRARRGVTSIDHPSACNVSVVGQQSAQRGLVANNLVGKPKLDETLVSTSRVARRDGVQILFVGRLRSILPVQRCNVNQRKSE